MIRISVRDAFGIIGDTRNFVVFVEEGVLGGHRHRKKESAGRGGEEKRKFNAFLQK